MSDTHTITDDAILAAWNPRMANRWGSAFRREGAETLRALVESTADGVYTQAVHDGKYAPKYRIDVTSLRDRLGGWDAVWRAVLTDEGFEDIERLGREWHRLREPHPTLSVERGAGGHYALAVLGYWIPLHSPAHLRVRKKAAEILFEEGPR